MARISKPTAAPTAAPIASTPTTSRKPGANGAAAAATTTTPTAAKAPSTTPVGTSGVNAFQGVLTQASTAIAQSGPGPYEMVPGLYPDAVSLPDFLKKMGATPGGQAAVAQLLGTLKAKTGIVVPPEVQAELLSNPSAATSALVLTPRQVSTGITGLNAAYQDGKVKPVVPDPNLLPQSFDLSTLASLNAPRPTLSLTPVGPPAVAPTAPAASSGASNATTTYPPGLYTGDLPPTVYEAQVKANRVMAEVFTRLGTDLAVPDAQKFSVQYGGQTYSRIDDFLNALKADGYNVNVSFQARIANFADLKTPVPNTNPQQWLDVPAPLMLKTGIKDKNDPTKEAVVPASHSQMIITLASGPNTKGPKLDSQVRFFQGIDGTGFFPAGVAADPTWLGNVVHDEINSDQAIKAISLAGALSDVIDSVAKSLNLSADGYGVTGVCNDSVAIVQLAVTGKAPQYPLFMHEKLLIGGLKQWLADPANKDHPVFQTLKDAIEKLPSDIENNTTVRPRALASLPWVAGKEPFPSTVEARRILSQQ